MTYVVMSGRGYTVRARHGDEIHQTETDEIAYLCDRGCARRYLDQLGVPLEVMEHPLGHGAGDFIDLRDTDERGDHPTFSWGARPCPETSCHEYCPACGALTVHGIEDSEDAGRSCDGVNCDWPNYIEVHA